MSFLSIWWYSVFRPDLTNEVILQLSHHGFVCVKGLCRDVTFNNLMLPERLIFFVVCNRRTFKFEVQMILYRQYNCLSLLNQWWKCSTHICIFQGVGIENLSFLAFSWFTLSPGEKSDVIEKIFLCFTARVLLPALWRACL